MCTLFPHRVFGLSVSWPYILQWTVWNDGPKPTGNIYKKGTLTRLCPGQDHVFPSFAILDKYHTIYLMMSMSRLFFSCLYLWTISRSKMTWFWTWGQYTSTFDDCAARLPLRMRGRHQTSVGAFCFFFFAEKKRQIVAWTLFQLHWWTV